MESKNEIISYLENASLLILGILFLAFPIVFTNLTTDLFVLPKQILLGVSVLLLVLAFGVRMLVEGRVTFRRTPFDLSLFLLIVFAFASCLFAVNRFDSLIAFVPFLLAALSFIIVVNVVKKESSLFFLISILTTVAIFLSILAILSFLKIYIFPWDFTKQQIFTPLGSLLDQAFFLGLVLPLALYLAAPLLRVDDFKQISGKMAAFALTSIVAAIGFVLTLYELLVINKPLLLPFEIGFQTAFAAISQDAGRTLQGFLFGSGFGTYMIDFTRFKQAAYNLNPTLWSFTFFRSSSFVLELLATTGVLGITTFILLILRVLKNGAASKKTKNPFFLPVLLLIISSFLLPFSFISYSLLFLFLGLFAAFQGLKESESYFDVEFQFVALRKGLLTFVGVPQSQQEKSLTRFLPISFFVLIVLLFGAIAYFSIRYITSDITFQKSLVAASQNNGSLTYQLQAEAISTFPYRDSFHRVFSQTNLALANSLSAQQPQGSSPSADIQRTIVTFIQQSINVGRNATNVSPQTTTNWQNLSSIYRGLIGFGQSAENFAITTVQQAIVLDPNNPQLYIALGGIYYQLQQWDNAQRQFQVAINLKPDFANAYYNLGHVLENKGDLENALIQYLTVRTLVQTDENNLKLITQEIENLQKRIETNQAAASTPQTAGENESLGINQPKTKLPEQKEPIKIPSPPSVTPSPSPSPSPSSTPTPTPSE